MFQIQRLLALGPAKGRKSPATYQPLVQILAAAALGIIVDRHFSLPAWLWVVLSLSSIVAWVFLFRLRCYAIASTCVLGATAALFGFLHATNHWAAVDGDIYDFARADQQPTCVQGVINSQPHWIAPSRGFETFTTDRGFRSRFRMRVTGIRDGLHFAPASGDLEVFVAGQVSGVFEGQHVEVLGKLSRINPPGNPGQFDTRAYFLDQGIRCWLIVDHPDKIRPTGMGRNWVQGGISRLRSHLDYMLWKHVHPDRAALASAMLLGNREQLDELERHQFLITGTVHLLAISGLHVGILIGLILCLPRVGLVSRRSSLLLAVLFAIAFAWIVEFRPPVVRAAILIIVYCYCKWVGREPFSLNKLALAGLIVLVLNPSDLFNTGAQLSFLAVATLMVCFRNTSPRSTSDPVLRLIEASKTPGERMRDSMWQKTRAAFGASAVIWLATAPLVALRFHVVAPIGLIANPLLLIPITMALVSGFGVLLFGWLIPPLGALFGRACDLSLCLVQGIVDVSELVPASHFWTSGPAPTAVLLFYLGFLWLVAYRPMKRSCAGLVVLSVAWVSLGWIYPDWSSRQKRRDTLACTFVDVGHGTCVLLQLPGDQNILYDCGSFGSPKYGQESASGVLWYHRITHLDAVVISHADADHFNALPDLAERFSIGQVLFSPAMNSVDHGTARRLRDHLVLRGIKVSTISRGHRLAISGPTEITVRGPPLHGTEDSDNSDSIVLDVSCRGFRILLPGDLEGTGLDLLLSQPSEGFDVVMAPHHGSLRSRPAEFYRWSRPKVVVVSSDDASQLEDLRGTLPRDCRVFHTVRDGATRVEVRATGYNIRTWHESPW